MKFQGIYTPLVTPYHDDFTVNKDALAKTVDLLVNAGVHGLIVAGTTGEYYAQSTDERLALMAQVNEMLAGRLPLIVGTGAIRTEESVAFAKAAKAVGADAIFGRDTALCLSHRPRNRTASDGN